MARTRYYGALQDRRDDAVERVRRVFRWTVLMSLGTVAVIFGVVSHQIPGRSTTPTPSSGAAPSPAGGAGGTPVASTGSTGNTGVGNTGNSGSGSVASPPAATQNPPTVVSGGTGW